jgi:hypothetical protein
MAEDLEFEDVRESWNIYRLDDGAIIKVKLVLVRLVQENMLDALGKPALSFLVNPVLGSVPPKQTLGSTTPENNLVPTPVGEVRGSEYRLQDGTILMFTPHISQINKTDMRDQRGDPMYLIQVQPIANIKNPNLSKK